MENQIKKPTYVNALLGKESHTPSVVSSVAPSVVSSVAYNTVQPIPKPNQNINSYIHILGAHFNNIVKEFNNVQLSDYTKNTIEHANDLLYSGNNLRNILKTHLASIDNLLSDCSNLVSEITEELSVERPVGGYVYHTTKGMLSFPMRDLMVEPYGPILPCAPYTVSPYVSPTTVPSYTVPCKYLSQLYELRTEPHIEPRIEPVDTIIPHINYNLKIPHVSDLSQIPPAIYYSDKPTSGLYMRLINNNIVQIPFPEIIDSKKEYNRNHSIKCKWGDKRECLIQRQKLAKIHNSVIRTCNFAHSGDQLVKVGYPSRCPTIPSFGNPSTFKDDLKYVTETDVKNMLMYGLNDIIIASTWLDYANIVNTTFDKLDYA